MHSFKFRELARDFRVSSYLFIASAITALITLLCSALFFFTSQQIFILTAASSGGLFIFLWLGFWGRSNRSRCQLCNTPVFKRLRCNKSSQARPLFGSYRLRVSTTIIQKAEYRCPYCGEHFSIQVPKESPSQTSLPIGPRTRRAGRSLPKKR
jgi:hypothetical protein